MLLGKMLEILKSKPAWAALDVTAVNVVLEILPSAGIQMA